MFLHRFLFQTIQLLFGLLFGLLVPLLLPWCVSVNLLLLLSPFQMPLTNVSPLSVSPDHIIAGPSLLSFHPASRSHAFSFSDRFYVVYFHNILFSFFIHLSLVPFLVGISLTLLFSLTSLPTLAVVDCRPSSACCSTLTQPCSIHSVLVILKYPQSMPPASLQSYPFCRKSFCPSIKIEFIFVSYSLGCFYSDTIN